jgi:hypothetical protein
VGLWLQCVTTLETVDLIVIGIAAWNLFTSWGSDGTKVELVKIYYFDDVKRWSVKKKPELKAGSSCRLHLLGNHHALYRRRILHKMACCPVLFTAGWILTVSNHKLAPRQLSHQVHKWYKMSSVYYYKTRNEIS